VKLACVKHDTGIKIGRCYFPSLWAENSPVCHFCPSLRTDKSGQCGLFSVHRICFFYFSPTKDLAPFSIYAPQKNPLLTHKLSILQLNQASFDLPGSAIICPTHEPSSRSSPKSPFINSEKNTFGCEQCAQNIRVQ